MFFSFLNSTSTLKAFTGGHQWSWTLTPANSMQVSIICKSNKRLSVVSDVTIDQVSFTPVRTVKCYVRPRYMETKMISK